MKIDFSKAGAPRVHGNGFLQIDIEPDTRLHIWGHRDLPRQTVDTAIHDHRFSFISRVLKGRLVHAPYYPGSDYAYRVFEPRTRVGEDTVLCDTGRCMFLQQSAPNIIRENEQYVFVAKEFHESFSDRPSATLMTKYTVLDHTPRVLVPLNKEPDNEFNRYDFPVEMLYGIIKDVLGYV